MPANEGQVSWVEAREVGQPRGLAPTRASSARAPAGLAGRPRGVRVFVGVVPGLRPGRRGRAVEGPEGRQPVQPASAPRTRHRRPGAGSSPRHSEGTGPNDERSRTLNAPRMQAPAEAHRMRHRTSHRASGSHATGAGRVPPTSPAETLRLPLARPGWCTQRRRSASAGARTRIRRADKAARLPARRVPAAGGPAAG